MSNLLNAFFVESLLLIFQGLQVKGFLGLLGLITSYIFSPSGVLFFLSAGSSEANVGA